jgi:ribosomal protein L11 methyltransferase
MSDFLIHTCVESGEEIVDALSEWIEQQTGIAPGIYSTPDSPRVQTSIYQSPDDPRLLDVDTVRSFIAGLESFGLDTGDAQVSQNRTIREDWAESWKAHFHPIEVEDRMVVRPSWEPPPASPSIIDIVIDPGLSFGTGHHQTTHYCLSAMVRRIGKSGMPASFLDAGTGSGILAIAAARMGIPKVIAFDNDPESIRVAIENATVNRVEFEVFEHDLATPHPTLEENGPFEMIAANILAETLVRYAAQLSALVAPNGILLTAGILEDQFEPLSQCFNSHGLALIEAVSDGPWKSGTFRKKG